MADRGIYKKPNSPYWWIRYASHGRMVRKSTKSTSIQEARRIYRDELHWSRVDKNESKVMYEDIRALIVQDYVRNGHDSYVLDKSRLTHLDKAFGGRPVLDIRIAQIEAYITSRLAEGAAPASVNRELAALRRMFNLAVTQEVLDRRTPPKIQALRENNVRKGFFEASQVEAVCKHLPKHLVPVIRVAAITGWRVHSELLTRQLKHVDLHAGWLRLDPGETKNGEGREFPIKGVLREIIETQIQETRAFERANGRVVRWLFHREGRPIKGFRKAWRRACTLSGQPGKLVHDLRRTAVRDMERIGIGRRAAMALVGHKTESMYRRYVVVDSEMLQEAASKLLEQHNHGTLSMGTEQVLDKKPK